MFFDIDSYTSCPNQHKHHPTYVIDIVQHHEVEHTQPHQIGQKYKICNFFQLIESHCFLKQLGIIQNNVHQANVLFENTQMANL